MWWHIIKSESWKVNWVIFLKTNHQPVGKVHIAWLAGSIKQPILLQSAETIPDSGYTAYHYNTYMKCKVGMREVNKCRTLLSRMLLKMHSAEEPGDNHMKLVWEELWWSQSSSQKQIPVPQMLNVFRVAVHSQCSWQMQCKVTWDLLVLCTYSSSIAIGNRNNLLKLPGVCVRKESSNISYVPDRAISILLPQHQDSCFCLLCLQLCCTWCGWCWEKADALCFFIIPGGCLSLEHSLPALPSC